MRIDVELPSGGYPVVVSPGGLSDLGPAIVSTLGPQKRVFVVSDTTVWPLVDKEIAASLNSLGIDFELILIGCGEAQKTVQTWSAVMDDLLKRRIDRSTPVVAVGGGLVGDVAGFAAATVMRGVPLVQVPTTLLAMVDSSVGGKTGVNTSQGKNLIGTFYQPVLVYAGIDVLRTLPSLEFSSGLGEVVKHALLGDEALFARCESDADAICNRDSELLAGLVRDCVAIKAGVVAQDERDSGWRSVLNLGHTVGHAIESTLLASGVASPHGVCVSAGLVAETRWAETKGWCDDGTSNRVGMLLKALGVPDVTQRLDLATLLEQVKFDKKIRRGKLTTAIVQRVGSVRLAEIDTAEVEGLFNSLQGF